MANTMALCKSKILNINSLFIVRSLIFSNPWSLTSNYISQSSFRTSASLGFVSTFPIFDRVTMFRGYLNTPNTYHDVGVQFEVCVLTWLCLQSAIKWLKIDYNTKWNTATTICTQIAKKQDITRGKYCNGDIFLFFFFFTTVVERVLKHEP